MGFKFENIKEYTPKEPPYGLGTMYFTDDKGNDWYEVSWALPAGTKAVMVDIYTHYVRGFTSDVPNKPLSIVADCSVYEVDELPDLSSWDWFYSPDVGFYKETSEGES